MLYHQILLSAALFAAGIHADSHLPAPEGHVKVHVVQVGGPGGALKYYPESLQVNPGELVQFQFHPKNHTVTQSTFDQPCVPLDKAQPGSSGIKSGFIPVTEGAAEIPVFTVLVNDTKPIWLYCGQGPHCQKGMVMAINAPATGEKTLEAYKAAAAEFGGSGGGGGGYGGGYPIPSGTGSGPQPTGGYSLNPSPTPTVPPTGVLPDTPAEQTTNAASPLSVPEFTGFLGLVLAMFAMLG